MIERRADWKPAEQSGGRFFPTISPSAVGERRAGCPPLHPSTIAPSSGRAPRGRGRAIPFPSRVPAAVLCFIAKQEAKMNWVKCTDMNKQPIYVNIENATSIRWDEKEKSSIIAFAVTGGDTIEVIEEPDAIIRGQ
jgi:hypothetical protein